MINYLKYIVIGSFLMGLFYRAVRAIWVDSYFWIAIFPIVGFWVIYKGGLRTIKFNTLDKIFYYFFIYGVFITLSGFVLAPGNSDNYDTFLHIYLPISIYFISRIYFYYKDTDIIKLYKWLVLIATLIIIDVFVEYYLFIVPGNPENIPWVKHSMEGAESWGVTIWNYSAQKYDAPTNFMTIFAGAKSAGLFIAVIFCALMPLGVEWKYSSKVIFKTIGKFKYAYFPLMFAVLHSSILVPSLSNTASLIFISSIILLYNFKLKWVVVLPFLVSVVFFIYKDVLLGHYINEVTTYNAYNNTSSIEFIFQIKPLIDTYINSNPLVYVFGSSILPMFHESSMSELDIFLLPLKHGIGWLILVMMGSYRILKYQWVLVNSRHTIVKLIGLSFFGIFGVIITNLHYPKFYAHGIYELFLISMGTMSSVYQRYIEKSLAIPSK